MESLRNKLWIVQRIRSAASGFGMGANIFVCLRQNAALWHFGFGGEFYYLLQNSALSEQERISFDLQTVLYTVFDIWKAKID